MKNESGEKPGKCVMHQTDSGKVALTLRALWCYYKQFLLINYVLCIGLCIERFSLKHDHCLLLRPLCDMCPVIRYKRMCVICSQSKTPIDYGGNLRWTGLLYWWSSHAVSCCRHPCAILLIWSSGLKHDNIFFYFFFQACYSYVPYGDTGSGYYSKKAGHTSQGIAAITPVILESLQSIPLNPRSLFTIADYGCADGGTSMPLICACVKKLKELHGDDLEINIQYEDQPFNDFKSLFSFVQGTFT